MAGERHDVALGMDLDVIEGMLNGPKKGVLEFGKQESELIFRAVAVVVGHEFVEAGHQSLDVDEAVRVAVALGFEDLAPDVPHNRILRSTLSALLRVRDLDRDVRAGVRSASEKLAGVTVVRVTRRMFDQVQLDGNRRYYHFLLSVCRLVHDLLLVDPRSGEHRFAGLTDAVMWKVYEDFVIEFYRREQDRYRVSRGGRTIRWAREGTHE